MNSPDTELFHKGNVLYNFARARKAQLLLQSGEVAVCAEALAAGHHDQRLCAGEFVFVEFFEFARAKEQARGHIIIKFHEFGVLSVHIGHDSSLSS